MQSHSPAMANRMTRRLKEAIPSRWLVLKLLANEIRAAREKTPIGTCSRIGSGKRSRIATPHEVKVRDRHHVAAAEIVAAEVEIVADAAAGIVVDVAEIAVDAAAVGIAVDGKNGLARRDRHVPKTVRAATSLVRPTLHQQLLEVNPVIRPLGRDVMTAHAMIVARELNADLIVTRAATNHDRPLRVNRRLQQTFPMISVPAFLKNNRRRHGHLPFPKCQLRPLARHARKRWHKARKPLMRCCGIRIVPPGNPSATNWSGLMTMTIPMCGRQRWKAWLRPPAFRRPTSQASPIEWSPRPMLNRSMNPNSGHGVLAVAVAAVVAPGPKGLHRRMATKARHLI